jgi:hypothetical protein
MSGLDFLEILTPKDSGGTQINKPDFLEILTPKDSGHGGTQFKKPSCQPQRRFKVACCSPSCLLGPISSLEIITRNYQEPCLWNLCESAKHTFDL